MSVDMVRRLFTVEEYRHMAEAGILTANDRVELIEGEVVEMTPIGSRHAACVAGLAQLLSVRVQDRARVWPQNPVKISVYSEPQPDVALLRPRAVPYRDAGPTAADVLLIIEVADRSLTRDRRVKIPLYAMAGIPEVWIVDLEGGSVEVYTAPTPTNYSSVSQYRRGESVCPSAFPDLHLSVDEIFA